MSEARLQRFFVQEDGMYRVSRDLSGMVVFSQQNVVMDPPFTNIDLLGCRNLLIYLETDLQRKLLPLFHYALRSIGYLVLGNSETVTEPSLLFAPLPGRTRLYKRRSVLTTYDPIEVPPVFNRPRAGVGATEPEESRATRKAADMLLLTNELLLQSFAPAAVLTTSQGDIVYLCGTAGQYLQPPAGKASMSVFAMTRDGLATALHEIFSKAVREPTTRVLPAVRVGSGQQAHQVDLSVQPLSKPQALAGMVLVVFSKTSVAASGAAALDTAPDTRLAELADELQHLREEPKATHDAMQTSQEERRASNEELESVNRERSARAADMQQASDDMKNLLNSTAIATPFLDEQMRVRRFTTQARSIFKRIASDIGRPITDLVNTLHYPQLAADAQEVLRTLASHGVQVAGECDGWFLARTMPYRTQDNRIDGVVITFVDISAQKAMENGMQQALLALRAPGQEPQAVLQQVQALLQGAASQLPAP